MLWVFSVGDKQPCMALSYGANKVDMGAVPTAVVAVNNDGDVCLRLANERNCTVLDYPPVGSLCSPF